MNLFELESEFKERELLSDGTYKGLIKSVEVFISRKNQKLINIRIGTKSKVTGNIVEYSRIYMADYYVNSELYKFIKEFEALEGRKILWNKLKNKPLQFNLKTYEKNDQDIRQYVEEMKSVECLDNEDLFDFDINYAPTENEIVFHDEDVEITF